MSLFLFLREALSNLSGHRLLSMATTVTIALMLMVFGLFLLIFVNLQGIAGVIREQVFITAYLRDGLSTEQLRRIEEQIRRLPVVERITFTSKAEALKEFESKFEDQSAILQGLTDNPLPASFDIMIERAYQIPEVVREVAKELRLIDGVEEVQDGLDWLGRFTTVARFIKFVGLGIGALLGVAVITISANTIRLSIYARRDEIELMRLIGAKDGFIRAPFFIEGAFVGLSGGILAMLSLGGLFVLFRQRYLGGGGVVWPGLDVRFFSPEILLVVLGSAAVLGGMGGYFSARSFLRMSRGSGSL